MPGVLARFTRGHGQIRSRACGRVSRRQHEPGRPISRDVNRQVAKDANDSNRIESSTRPPASSSMRRWRSTVSGSWMLESLYEQALSVEFGLRGFASPASPIAITYRTSPVGEARLDFLVADRLVVELKAAHSCSLSTSHRSYRI